MEDLTKKCIAKLYRRLIVIGQRQEVKTCRERDKRGIKYKLSLYVVIFTTDLEFANTLVFKKPIAILTSTSTIDINVPTSETRIGSSMKQKDSIAPLVRKFSYQKRCLETVMSPIDFTSASFSCHSVIARRRIQHSTEAIGSLIDQCDLVELPPEHAELLLKFVPTKEEVSTKYDTVPQRERFRPFYGLFQVFIKTSWRTSIDTAGNSV